MYTGVLLRIIDPTLRSSPPPDLFLNAQGHSAVPIPGDTATCPELKEACPRLYFGGNPPYLAALYIQCRTMMLEKNLVRWSVLGGLMLCMPLPHVCAQDHTTPVYFIELQPVFSVSDAKHVHEALMANDPGCSVSVDIPTQRIKVRTAIPVVAEHLQASLAGSGLHVVSVTPYSTKSPVARSEGGHAGGGFPVFVDTGNPAQDQANYAAAKAAWVAADPGRYEGAIHPDEGTTDPSGE